MVLCVFSSYFVATAELSICHTVVLLAASDVTTMEHALNQNSKIGYPILWGLASLHSDCHWPLKTKGSTCRIISLTLLPSPFLNYSLISEGSRKVEKLPHLSRWVSYCLWCRLCINDFLKNLIGRRSGKTSKRTIRNRKDFWPRHYWLCPSWLYAQGLKPPENFETSAQDGFIKFSSPADKLNTLIRPSPTSALSIRKRRKTFWEEEQPEYVRQPTNMKCLRTSRRGAYTLHQTSQSNTGIHQ